MKELNYTELKNTCDPYKLGFKTTKELECYNGIIGQERAVKAFEFGLNVKMKGYNIYVAGPSGSGKTTYAKQSTEKKAKNEKVPYDWCYVYNFDDPRCPLSLRFEPGIGKQFRDDMNELVSFFKTELSKAFSSEDYDRQKIDLSRVYDEKRDVMIKRLDSVAADKGFSLKTSNSGIIFQPIIDGEPIDEENYDNLPENVKEGINERLELIQDDVNSIMRDIKAVDKEYKQKMDDLDYKVGMFAIGHYVSSLQEKYQNSERVIKYLEAVQEDVLENIDQFTENEPDEDDPIAALIPKLSGTKTEDVTLKYRVNLIVDNSKTEGAPVIVDYNPTYYNLVGEVEYDNEYGNLTTDFMKIKAGSMHKANGGYIMKPYVVNEIKDSSGMTVYKNEPVKVKQAVSSESCALMKKYLISVVDNGTGKKAKVEGYSIAGKSGTGEQGNRDEDTYTITFAGYFPAEDPKISALVIIDKPKDYADGVTTAAPIFKTLAEKIIDYMNFEPTTVSIETNPLPDFTGYDISDAEEVLTRLGLEFKIVGTEETVVNQFPKGETAVYDKMEVILYTQ